MRKSIQISIQKPCLENWENMTNAEKGRFCASCQKQVYDFTQSTDIEIVKAFKDNGNLCGLFLESQLERDLIVPREKRSFWLAACLTITGYLLLGNQKAAAQKVETIEQQLKNKNLKTEAEPILLKTITGKVVIDSIKGQPLQGITISALYSDNKTQTDAQGNFSLMINDWDKPVFTDKSYDFTIVDSDEDNGFLNVIGQKKSNDKMNLFLGGAKAVGVKIEQKEAQRPGMLFIWDFFN